MKAADFSSVPCVKVAPDTVVANSKRYPCVEKDLKRNENLNLNLK